MNDSPMSRAMAVLAECLRRHENAQEGLIRSGASGEELLRYAALTQQTCLAVFCAANLVVEVFASSVAGAEMKRPIILCRESLRDVPAVPLADALPAAEAEDEEAIREEEARLLRPERDRSSER